MQAEMAAPPHAPTSNTVSAPPPVSSVPVVAPAPLVVVAPPPPVLTPVDLALPAVINEPVIAQAASLKEEIPLSAAVTEVVVAKKIPRADINTATQPPAGAVASNTSSFLLARGPNAELRNGPDSGLAHGPNASLRAGPANNLCTPHRFVAGGGFFYCETC